MTTAFSFSGSAPQAPPAAAASSMSGGQGGTLGAFGQAQQASNFQSKFDFCMARLVVPPTGALSMATASRPNSTKPPIGDTTMAPHFSSPAQSMAVDSDADQLADQFASLNVFAQPLTSVPAPAALSAADSEADRYLEIAKARPKSLIALTSLAEPTSSLALTLASMSLSGSSSSSTSKGKETDMGNPFLRVGQPNDKANKMADPKSKGKETGTAEKKVAPRRKKAPVSCFIQPKRQTPKPPASPPPGSVSTSAQPSTPATDSCSTSVLTQTTSTEKQAADGEHKTKAPQEKSNSTETETTASDSLESSMAGLEIKLPAKSTHAAENPVKPPIKRAAVTFPPGALRISMASIPAAPMIPAISTTAPIVESAAS
ncbi:uncharacterized protein SPSK_00123 [Sporothrix schenckii 1099-18]|uniref:Uncharacterized protein n=1 Tax=Sporothrix schenckii 1099-18 TaxID=1397361 RepID=A0A0F2M230_SPOSC|nr:uncharacterized protein SPSK_00123 [Sporothrix schenckii 1099-18]KJR83768.1 hypothetical protein SPSK_00123 [Sporothrix schenckii 1099-18]